MFINPTLLLIPMRLSYLVIPLIALLFLSSVYFVFATGSSAQIPEIGQTSLYIFGVTIQNGTEVGVPAQLSLTVTNGTGRVFLGSTPLAGADTQAQAVVSVSVACELLNLNCNDYNFYYYISSSSANISGPSAGAAFTIAAMSVLAHKPLDSQVAMTGTANPDGSIGIVGGVAAKSEAAANQGIKIFLYPSNEPTQDNITFAALSYDENLGMIPIAVNSIYQAFNYFTGGYNATPPLNYSIYTPLYNSLMEHTYQQFNAYQQNIYNSLPSKTSSNSTINGSISAALSLMQQEKNLTASGKYYVAASDVVASALDLVYADTLEQLSTASDPSSFISNLISAENGSIQNTYNKITGSYLTNSSTLELKLIAIDRLNQASFYLNISKSEANVNSFNAVSNYSLAEVKRASALFWVSILPEGNSNFSESSYYNMSNYYLYRAASLVNYAILLGAPYLSDINLMNSYFSKAQTYQNSGHYVSSIFDSLEATATAELIIEENSIVINGSETQVENQIADSALRLINSAENAGVTPFLGISYYQLGESYVNYSAYLYVQYESFARVYTDFEKDLINSSSLPYSLTFQPLQVPAATVFTLQDLKDIILGIAIGAVIAGVIYEYKLFRILKRNKLIPRSPKIGKNSVRKRK